MPPADFSLRLVAQNKPVFAEDFESGKIDPAMWELRVRGTATIAVEAVESGHGKYSLHLHYPAMAARSYAFAGATKLPESVRSQLFGRVYMKIPPGASRAAAFEVP